MSHPGLQPRLTLPQAVVPPFSVHIDVVAGHVTLAGPLDRHTSHLLVDAFATLGHSAAERWTVDLGSLSSCDVRGLRALSAGYRCALRRGRRLSLLGASPALQRQLIWLRLAPHVLGPGDLPSAA
jgi:anti-anti-sigma regulatory factor